MKKLISALIAMWATGLWITASAFTSVGTVVDEANEPIIGATVSTGGGKALGSTDIDGKFKVNVPTARATSLSPTSVTSP